MLIAKQNFTLIILGASGSLAKLKIFPALYEMALEGRMPEDYLIMGYARSKKALRVFRSEFKDSVLEKYKEVDDKVLSDLLDKVYYLSGQYDEVKDYVRLQDEIEKYELNEDRVRIAYFAIPPSVFAPAINGLGETLQKVVIPLSLVIEKPVGSDLESAKELEKLLYTHFKEEEVFLLDHYLGKESVFNLLALRYANSILSNLIRGEFVANIQITAMEKADIEGRAGYFNDVGTFKDMMQSHLFQILTFLTMYIPREFTSDLVHKSKVQLLENLYFDGENKNVVLGQYEGYDNDGEGLESSLTETFAAVKVGIDSSDWNGVPIYLRTGKCLQENWTSVVIEFKPHGYQKKLKAEVENNKLVIIMKPEEKIEFHLQTKRGGEDMEFIDLIANKNMYCNGDCLSEHARLLLEVLKGDHLLFLDFPEVYEAWKVTDSIVKMCDTCIPEIYKYKCGSLGPEVVNELIEKDGFKWHEFN